MMWIIILAFVAWGAWRWLDRHNDGTVDEGELFIIILATDFIKALAKWGVWSFVFGFVLVGLVILDLDDGAPASPLSFLQGVWVGLVWLTHGIHAAIDFVGG